MKPRLPVLANLAAICICSTQLLAAEPAKAPMGSSIAPQEVKSDAVDIRTGFPGGNVRVNQIKGATVNLGPDLRGDREWFYWYFEAKAHRPGRITFVFPPKLAGFKDGAIGFQGPGISTDGGKTWDWMGTKNGRGSSFYYEFTRKGQMVRFSSTLPYLHSDFERFLKANTKNTHLTKSVLTKSRGGRAVELIRIGAEGPGVRRVLITARHHANESVASFVLEGFLDEAISDRPSGQAFRKKYVAYVIPFVDKDGVERGDQGKNRRPHDHNREYNEKSIYPEITAIKKLDDEKNFEFTFDLHCPTLVMDIHQRLYFTGIKAPPKHNYANLVEFTKQIKLRLPKGAPHGPVVLPKPPTTKRPMNSHHFGFKKGKVMVATLEIPFAPPKPIMHPAALRQYGQSILGAWAHMTFIEPD